MTSDARQSDWTIRKRFPSGSRKKNCDGTGSGTVASTETRPGLRFPLRNLGIHVNTSGVEGCVVSLDVLCRKRAMSLVSTSGLAFARVRRAVSGVLNRVEEMGEFGSL